MDRICKNCCFFTKLPESSSNENGQCHRYPPPPYEDTEGKAFFFVYPIVRGEVDWCGEFQKKEETHEE